MSAHLAALSGLLMVTLVAVALPGPNNFLVMRLALRHGRAAAVTAGLGVTLSCLAWSTAASLGLGSVLAAAPWLQRSLALLGGIYLLCFAWGLVRSQPTGTEVGEPASERGHLWRGFAINMTNPKSLVFFGSIFSAYVGPAQPQWLHASAVAVVCLTCLGWGLLTAWLFATPALTAAYTRARRPIDVCAALVMAAFGLALLWPV